MTYELRHKTHPRCSECSAPFEEYNSNDVVCSDVCARARKVRLQRERREKKYAEALARARKWYEERRAAD